MSESSPKMTLSELERPEKSNKIMWAEWRWGFAVAKVVDGWLVERPGRYVPLRKSSCCGCLREAGERQKLEDWLQGRGGVFRCPVSEEVAWRAAG